MALLLALLNLLEHLLLKLFVPLLEVFIKVLIVLSLCLLLESLSLAAGVTLEVLFEALLGIELFGRYLSERELGSAHD